VQGPASVLVFLSLLVAALKIHALAHALNAWSRRIGAAGVGEPERVALVLVLPLREREELFLELVRKARTW
jgi:hypothetical protein